MPRQSSCMTARPRWLASTQERPSSSTPPGKTGDAADVVFVLGVEPADRRGGFAPDQPVGADDAAAAVAEIVVDDQQVVGDGVEAVAVAAGAAASGDGCGAHLLVEDAVAQRLGGVDLGCGLGDANAELAGADLAEAGWRTLCSPIAVISGGEDGFGVGRPRACGGRVSGTPAAAEQLEPVADQVEAEPGGDGLDQALVVGVSRTR